ncbi:MAG: HAD hydrolase family protein [Candidatus Aenigmarchaeota archaeon]|nr:HAD hydrolase family protein [Candidatus Aenigmarchaeota archaeon]
MKRFIPLIDKSEPIKALRKEYNFGKVIAVGDGANDIAMFEEADIAVGIAPKDIVRKYTDYLIESKDLWELIGIFGEQHA